jgi:uncharacterized Zn finger protein (UPF0148 family)
MDSDFNEDNTARCPKCEWVSITKKDGQFVCVNPSCDVHYISTKEESE